LWKGGTKIQQISDSHKPPPSIKLLTIFAHVKNKPYLRRAVVGGVRINIPPLPTIDKNKFAYLRLG
jgi:hypothetical protein